MITYEHYVNYSLDSPNLTTILVLLQFGRVLLTVTYGVKIKWVIMVSLKSVKILNFLNALATHSNIKTEQVSS